MTVQALRERRPEVLGDLLERYGREIQGVAYLILHDHQAAEDVVVETLLAAFDHAGSLRDPDALRPWLLRIAVNRALGVRRSGARLVQLNMAPDQPRFDPDAAERLTLLGVVHQLPVRMRAAVVLRYYADMSVRDVAAALGTSENTVKTQLRESLERLRITLAETPHSREAIDG
jgi:RNA polymerase sigma factor (sigma-70 family)